MHVKLSVYVHVCPCNLTVYLPPLSLTHTLSLSVFPPFHLSLSLSPASLLDSLSLQTTQGSVMLKAMGSLRQDWAVLKSYKWMGKGLYFQNIQRKKFKKVTLSQVLNPYCRIVF